MKIFFQKNIITIIGIPLGAMAGYFYWKYVGCYSGSCAITSNPFNSTVYGAVMAGLIFSIFKKDSRSGY